MTNPMSELARNGVSVWLDDLSRERLETGNLAELIENFGVVGVTTNPSIFANALSNGERYRPAIARLVSENASADETIERLTTDDVRAACDVFTDVFERTNGLDGRVSIEVEPKLADDTDGTIEAAKRIWDVVDRPNVLIKIPATDAGLPAIAATIAAGISVNVTLIFSVDRYREVMDAYLYGLEQALAEGRDLASIHSVASFFISRLDSAIDAQLDSDSPLRGRAAVANAQLAHAAFVEAFESPRAQAIIAQGANIQRPLWASTGVKDPAYPDTKYVTELVVSGSVNTMPESTLLAFADHGEIQGDAVTGKAAEATEVFAALTNAGIDTPAVFADLESDGVSKFVASWSELETTVSGEMGKA